MASTIAQMLWLLVKTLSAVFAAVAGCKIFWDILPLPFLEPRKCLIATFLLGFAGSHAIAAKSALARLCSRPCTAAPPFRSPHG